MAREDLIKTLAKVIVAAAWADGEVNNDEINSLKDLLFHLPNLTAKTWQEIDIYVETPVDEAERARLIDELSARISSRADKQLAIEALNDMVQADGQITTEEQRVFNEIKAAIEEADTGIVGGLSNLIRGPVSRRSANTPNRERYIDDFVKNKVFYEVQRRLRLGEDELNLPEDKLRKLSLAGALMARVARVDKLIEDTEFDAIADALETGWHINRQEATFVAQVAVSDEAATIDNYRTERQFFNACTNAERLQFLDVLFQVAAADGMATRDEVEEIRSIARGLLLSHKEFIEAKLRIQAERRAT